ncbi:MAG: DNA-processing protein DprA [Marinosulfonomonas sp.]|nr:DNA-processing protein DprA [Marinosulfonomonas sp.]
MDALAVLPEVAKAAGVENYATLPEGVALAELRAGQLAGATLVHQGEPAYPADLATLSDAPPFFWALGNTDILTKPLVALVGARNASSLGTRMARRLAENLGQAGYVVVSGLARGIDAAAHLAALDTGTVAVFAGGVDVVYPAENASLAQEIGETGLRISEHPMGLRPQARHFPQRNRIISGISRAVVVVEAAAKSGSLITARNALDQGREVLAVPGHPFDARSSGCNMLIRDGATLVRGVDDVIEVLKAAEQLTVAPPQEVPQTPQKRAALSQEIIQIHTQILARLGPSPVAEDQLIRDLKLQASDITPQLVTLELDGKVTRQAGGLISLSS